MDIISILESKGFKLSNEDKLEILVEKKRIAENEILLIPIRY